MEHTQEQWDQLQTQLKFLREENEMLRRVVDQLKGVEIEEESLQSLTKSTVPYFEMKKSISKEIKSTTCPYCNGHGHGQKEKTKEELVNQLQNWSQKLTVSLFKKKEPELKLTHSGEFKESPIKKQESSIEEEEGLLEKICLFGPNQEKTVKMLNKKTLVPHQLYFPKEDPLHSLYESYGHSLYPESVDVKVIREKNKNIQIDKIIFRKSLKPTDYKLVIFQSKQEFSLPTNKIRKQWNPFSTIYCVSVDFPDYLHSNEPYQGIVNRTISMIDERSMSQDISHDISHNTEKSPEKSPEKLDVPGNLSRNNSSISVYGQESVYKSNFNLSVMSYYPLIDFFCQFLKQLINYIKINRIQEHSQHPSSSQSIDIRSVVQQMENATSIFKPLYSKNVEIGAKVQFKLGTASFLLELDQHKIREELSRDWAYRMLRLLDKDTLYEIYCLVMQQQSIVFACQNSYILTFMIYLFVGLLIHPFSYPHTIISSVFDLDHLQTPFIAIMGLNKPNSWLQENEEQLMQKMAGKVLIHIKDEEVKIKNRKKQKMQRSQKLRKVFANFYKRSQKLQGTTKRKQILTREITKGENELTVQLLVDIENFFNEELLRFKPNIEIIESMRQQYVKKSQNLAAVSAKLIKDIEQFIVKSRKNIERDPVVEMLLQKQIFAVYLTICYDIA